jgi:heptosyltransferase-2
MVHTNYDRILIIRLSSLGDIVLTTPVLRLLRENWPSARIDFVVKSEFQDVLRGHPCVDRLLLVNTNRESVWHTIRQLRETHYDLVLDLHRTWRSFWLYHCSRTKHRLSYRKYTLRRALLVYLKWNTLRHTAPIPERYALPLRRLGVEMPLPRPEVHVDAASVVALEQFLPAIGGQVVPQRMIAVAPGARWKTKQWPVARFAVVAQELATRHEATIILLGDRHDCPLVDLFRQHLAVPVIDAVGRLPLMQTAALLQRCRLLLCNDSGLMHLATALRVPVVAVFGPTVKAFGFYPFQAVAQVVSHPLPCRPCTTKGTDHCPRGHHGCMERIAPEQVVAAAETLWP